MVVHARRTAPSSAVRVGLVVSKAVGNAVTRNSVKRRLRHLAAACLADTPPGTDLVVRALPRAAQEPVTLRTDLPAAWRRVLERLAREEAR